MTISLYERLGGKNTILALVDAFYVSVLADPRVCYVFDNLDINAIREHQKKFMAYAFGGPHEYTGRSLRTAHKDVVEKYNLTDSHFDVIAEHLDQLLDQYNIGKQERSEVMAIVESTRRDVLNK